MVSRSTRVKEFLAPPVFPDDEDKTRTARVLNTLLLAMMLFLIFVGGIIVPFVFVEKLYNGLFVLAFFLALAVARWLMQRGRVRLASAMLSSAMWTVFTAFLLFAGGMTSIAALFYVAGTVTTGLLLGTRAALVHAAACSLAGLGMVVLEASGHSPPRLFPIPALTGWVDMVLGLLLTTTVLSLVLRSLNDALVLARQQIEERKQSEEALRDSEERLSSVVEHAGVGIIVLQDGQQQFYNAKIYEMLGYTEAEYKDIHYLSLVHPEDQPLAVDRMRQRLEGAATDSSLAQMRILAKSGEIQWIETSSVRIQWEGRPAIQAFVLDITERKQAEEALRESEEKYRTLVEQSLQGLVIIQDFCIVFANTAFAEISGYSIEELLSLAPEDVVTRIHSEDQALVWGHFRDPMAGKPAPPRYEYRGIRKDGTVRWLEMSANRIEYCGKPAIQAAVVDITERKQAEETVRESEERFRQMAESIQEIFWMTEPKSSRMLYVSPAYESIWQRSIEDLYKDPQAWMAPIHPDDVATVSANWEKQVQGASTYEEFRITRPDGSTRWIENRAYPIISEVGQVRLVTGVAQDITERKRAEETVQESEERLSSFMNSASDTFYLLDSDLNFVEINEKGLEIIGKNREDVIGKNITDIVPDVKESGRYERHLEVMRTGQPFVIDHFVPHPVFGDLHFMLKSFKVGDGLGVIASDMTERARAEEERERLLVQIREQAQRVQQILDTVPEGLFLLDANGLVVLVNPVAEGDLSILADAQAGDTLTHLGDRPLAELLTSPPKGLWHEVAADDRSFQVIARPIENGPTPAGWVMVLRDVTQQREIEKRIQQQGRLAAVGQLAAGIAHDFNNIMAAIVLYAQMTARMEGLPATVRERMETIDGQAKHATNLIQQILDFSRRAVLERRPLDLAPLLKEHVMLLERTLPESIEIKLDCEPDQYMVNADPTRMQQMVTNLALNAREAMSRGGELRIGLERIEVRPGESPLLPEMAAGEWITVTVSDTGTGIPPDALPHIFEPFFTTRAPLGSGLGLAQVHGIVGQHGGRIDVDTQVGKGTTFTIYLPLHPSEPSPVSSRAELPALPAGQGETILVVEDDAVVRRALADSLELLNYQVLEVSNGQEALETLEERQGEVALVLSDVVMPKMSGTALLHALRERGLTIQVVMLTGHPIKREMEELRAQGMADWLPKPPELEQLAEAVARALGTD